MPTDAKSPTPDLGATVAALEWSEAGEPRSTRFNDVYFSRDDGLAEARAVFLAGCGLPEAWAGRQDFVVAELGLGTGLNLLALLDLWRSTRTPGARLHIFSIEAYPMRADEARRALSAWPDLSDLAMRMLDQWPVWTPGFHRLSFDELNVTLDVAIGDAAWALSEWHTTGESGADAWFLDGFSPALNPEMWSDAVLDGIAARSAPGARLATFTVAGAVRRGLEQRGFTVEKRPGHGRKRQRLEARFGGETPAPADPHSVAIVGAGIAGASVARALMALGLSPVILEQDRPGAGASGFPAALVTPRLDAGDEVIAGFHAQALMRAASLYRAIKGAVTAEGVLQLVQADRDTNRFARIAAQPIWPPESMQVVEATAAAMHVGEPVQTTGLHMAQALAVRPAHILSAFLKGADLKPGRVARIETSAIGWRTYDAAGTILSDTHSLVLTAGWGLSGLDLPLILRPVRGQADWINTDSTDLPGATAWGGYLAPGGDYLLFGATHDRDQTTTEVRAGDSDRNRATLSARLPELAKKLEGQPSQARAAIRATTPDRLPVCGPLSDHPGMFVLSGLGSRGFCVAPLLGEHLAALIAGQPSPLPTTYADRLAAGRGSD